MRRPIIVIPARFSASASALRFRADVAATKLVQVVYDAGGEPFIMHPADELDDDVRDRLSVADGVLLPGGGDLAPHWSGQAGHETLYDVDEVQDAFDLALARVALADAVPLLAICRGSQVVNVARGGTLIQDLAEKLGHDHRPLTHEITGELGPLTISCYHHQALDQLGQGLRPVAVAADGVVEAIAVDDGPGWFLGVQWHPEDTADRDPAQAALFAALVEASREVR